MEAINEGDTVEVQYEASYQSRDATVTGEVVEVTDTGFIINDDDAAAFREVFDYEHDDDTKLIRSGHTRGELSTRHGTVMGTFTGVEVTEQAGPEVNVGEEYEVEGETVEVTNANDDRVCLHYKDREAPDGSAYTTWRPRTTVEAIAAREDWTLLKDNSDTDDSTLGEWVETPTCPDCGVFMSRDYDGSGLPAASCSRVECDGWMDDRQLIDGGYVEV